MCSDITIDDIFAGKPGDLLLAFDDLLIAVMDWQPTDVSAATKAIVFTNKRAWLIVRPMSKLLDIAFYTDGLLVAPSLHKSAPSMRSKYRHQIRISGPGEISTEVVELLRIGYNFGNR
jgi:hypothetical protein